MIRLGPAPKKLGSKTESLIIPRPDQTPPAGFPSGTTTAPPLRHTVKGVNGTETEGSGAIVTFTTLLVSLQPKLSVKIE